jgi:tRNA(Arg) A34 adenosine deaminase TadA
VNYILKLVRLEKYLSGNIFIQEEMKKHQQYIELVKDGSAIIVDPTTDGVLIKAHGNKTHLLQHSVMNAIDKIAYSQGGGVNSKTSLLQDPSVYDDIVILPQAKRSKLDSYLCTGYDLYIKMEPCIM